MAEVNFDNESLKTIIAKTVLDSLTPEQREDLIVKALKALFAPDHTPYGTKKSPLEELFINAANRAAGEVVRTEIEKPERRAAITDLVTQAFDKVLSDESRKQKVVDRMADALCHRAGRQGIPLTPRQRPQNRKQ